MDTADLEAFANGNAFQGPGPLGVGIVVTRKAKGKSFPLDPSDFLTSNQSRVGGLNGAAVNRVLQEHGVDQSIGTEAGRTSPASAENMRRYVGFLNSIHTRSDFDLEAVEGFWVERIKGFFDSKPLTIKLDPSLSVRAVVRDILAQAEKRQKESRGMTVVGTVMQHLVGAKLECVLGDRMTIKHYSANASDQTGRGGDFDLNDSCVHVTVKPGDLLFEKCRRNLSNGLRPIIVTSEDGEQLAQLQMDDSDKSRIDVLGIEQFVAANVHELGLFSTAARATAVADIIDKYNAIIDKYETNPSLRIAAE